MNVRQSEESVNKRLRGQPVEGLARKESVRPHSEEMADSIAAFRFSVEGLCF
jgi:hypothetical protein